MLLKLVYSLKLYFKLKLSVHKKFYQYPFQTFMAVRKKYNL